MLLISFDAASADGFGATEGPINVVVWKIFVNKPAENSFIT